jgi:WD40 repeat protein
LHFKTLILFYLFFIRSHNGRYIVTGGTAGILRLWDYKLGQQICEVSGHSGAINSCAFSPDDKQIISVGDDGAIFVWCVFNNDDNIGHK